MKEAVLYSEWVSAGKFLKAIIAFVIMLALLVFALVIWASIQVRNPPLAAVVAIPIAFLLAIYGNYRGIKIRITRNELTIHYGLLNRKHVQISDIVSCEPTKANLGKYWGVGIRFGTDRSFAYTTSFGDAVKIALRKGRPFVFSSHDPQEICSIINQTKASTRMGNDS